MVPIRKNLLPESLYQWKSRYKMTPTRIVVHNTANDASADAEVKYMHRTKEQGGVQVSYQYAVDDKEIVQAIEENRNGWHAGDGTNGVGNRQGIAIEICYSKSGGDRFIKAEENAVDLIVDILKRYGWGIDKVTKHQDYSGKYCPHRTLDIGWDRFLKMIEAKLEPETYTLVTDVPVYTNSANAVNGVSPVKTYEAGEYFVFNKSKGMINITKTVGKAGGWINPADNVIKEAPVEPEPPVENLPTEEPIPVDKPDIPEDEKTPAETKEKGLLLRIIELVINFVRNLFKK